MKTVLPFIFRSNMHRAYLAWVLALFVAILLPNTGIGGEIDRQLQNFRANLLEKPASGEVAIVEIDAKSIQALALWPWPREYYAQLVSKANAAGASQIVFDVDFSAKSSHEQDSLFATALAQSKASIVLPTFKQKSSPETNDYIESLPIVGLRKNALLGSVNVHPDQNGQLSSYSYGIVTGGKVRPSLAAMLAESSGNIGKSFTIDQSIDPATIPRYSFIDIMNADPGTLDLKGKKLLIGATAIEFGDRYPISRFGVIPGVVIQAMAAETLIQRTDKRNFGYWLPLAFVATLLALWLFSPWSRLERLAPVTAAISVTLFSLLLIVERLGLLTFSIAPAFAFLGMFLLIGKFLNITLALKTSMFVNIMSKLPNEAALEQALKEQNTTHIAVARLMDFRELLVVTDKHSRSDLFHNLSERLKFLAADEKVFHLDPDVVGWIIKDDYIEDIADHFATAAALFQSPVIAGESRVKLNATFGVSREFIDQAKVASEQARISDKRWSWYDDEEADAVGTKQNLLIELEKSLENREIWVVYQPKWSFSENRLAGAEALVRWNHPNLGLISPAIFIPLLEKAGRIDDLTLYVLQETLDNFSRWSERDQTLSCSVNISAMLLTDGRFIEKAIRAVDTAKINNENVIFEVTETATLTDIDLSIIALTRIRNAGIKISIDDYGTGQSTMSYLQRLPVDELKIDQSFVKTITTDKANRLMVQSTIALAHSLDLKVVAEGIEDEHCMELIKKLNCDVGQGWHISKPVTSEAFESTWLDAKNSQDRVTIVRTRKVAASS